MNSMKTLLVLLLVQLLSQCSHGQRKQPFFRKDYTFVEATQSFYKVHTNRRTWLEAKSRCELEGATLLHPDDEFEADVVWGLWYTTEPYDWIFLGMSDLLAEGVWETVEGRPELEVYRNWRSAEGEPNNANNNEHCALWRRDKTMSDYLCNDRYPFICRKTLLSLDSNTDCDLTDPNQPKPTFFRNDYTFIKESDAFYKVHTTRRNFQDAKRRCQMEGAILFHPENDAEAEIVMGLWNRSEPYGWIYLGVSDLLQKGVWETVDGRPLLDVYTNWGTGQPDDTGGIEDCVLWRRDKTLNDYSCHEIYPFICKKSRRNMDANLLCDVPNQTTKPAAFFRLDYTYKEETQAFYKVHTTRKVWLEARKQCQMEGATLFYPEDKAESEVVLGLWKKTKKSEPYEWIYLGMTDLLNEGTWETVDGRPIVAVYNMWRTWEGEPNNGGGSEDCSLWRSDNSGSDYTCTEAYKFICKKSLRDLDWNTLCDMPDPNYQYNKDLGKCYKFHLTPKKWSDAHAICSAEQSYLAIINSQSEADFLAKITEQAPKDKVRGNFVSGRVHLGFHNKHNDEWKTIKAMSLEDSGYAAWESLMPNHNDNNWTCGGMSYNSRLVNVDCTKRSFFICEHDIGLLSNAIDEKFALLHSSVGQSN